MAQTFNGNLNLPDAGTITYDIAPAVDHTASGHIFTGVAGETLIFGDEVYLKAADSRWYKAAATSSATLPNPFTAIVVTDASSAAGTTINLCDNGWVRDDSRWKDFTISGVVYTSGTAGALTQTAPSAEGNQIHESGYATEACNATIGVIRYKPSPIVSEVMLDSIAVTGTSQAITPANLTSQAVTYYGDNASDQTYTLGALSAADIGKKFTIVKTGTGAGKAIIQLPAVSYAYASGQASGAAGTVYLAASARGSMTWVVTSATEIQLLCADGSLTFV